MFRKFLIVFGILVLVGVVADAANTPIIFGPDGSGGTCAYNLLSRACVPTSAGSGDIEGVTAGTGIAGGGTSGTVTITALSDSVGILNCSITGSVASSALTIAIKDAAGSDPSATSPCTISFRNATAGTGTYAQVSFTGAASVVVSNGSSLGCTAQARCVLYVYAINNAGTTVLGVRHGFVLDEGTVQSSTAEGGAGAADSINTTYSTATQTDKAFRLLGRITIVPGASFAWDAAPVEISNLPVITNDWFIAATLGGANPSLGTSGVASQTEITNAGLTLTPRTGSAPVGTVCATTNAATAPSSSATTCAAGDEGVGLSFAVPTPGRYKVCVEFSWQIGIDGAELIQNEYELVETPTNAQTISQASGHGHFLGIGPPDTAGSNGTYDLLGNLCGVFNWTNKAAGTVVAVRLFYIQSIAGTPGQSIFISDGASSNRNIFLTVEKL